MSSEAFEFLQLLRAKIFLLFHLLRDAKTSLRNTNLELQNVTESLTHMHIRTNIIIIND